MERALFAWKVAAFAAARKLQLLQLLQLLESCAMARGCEGIEWRVKGKGELGGRGRGREAGSCVRLE